MLDEKSLEGLTPELRLVACKLDDLFSQLAEEGPTLNVITQINRWSDMAGIAPQVGKMVYQKLGIDTRAAIML